MDDVARRTASPSPLPPVPAESPTPALGLIADAVPAMMAYIDRRELRYRFANRGFAEFMGHQPDTIVGKTLREVVGEEMLPKIQPQMDAVLEGRSVRYVRERGRPDGASSYYEVQMLPHLDARGVVVGGFVLVADITHHRAAEQEARDAAERLRKFAEATDEGIAFHKDTRIVDVNDALLRILGYSRAEMLGRHTLEFVAQAAQQTVVEYITAQREDPYESLLLHRDGREVPVEMVAKTMRSHGDTWRLVVVRDISARQEAQRRIEFLAHHDTLTRLPNRARMHERLAQVLAMARRERRLAAVLFIDLDNFKHVNDSLGHHAGDQLLCEVAQRITGAVRQSDVVARLGGDEFVVVLAEVESEACAGLVAAKLLAVISEPVALEGRRVVATPSIGVSMYPTHGEEAEDLLRHADAAMYDAKDSGRGNVQMYRDGLLQSTGALLGLELQLREALARQSLALHYQPIWRLTDGAMVGVEALVRWHHPEDGLVGPDVFIAIAESRGLIAAIGRWVLAEACRQMKAWHDAGHAGLMLSINMSALEFVRHRPAEGIADVLRATGLPPHCLEIELTESVLMTQGSQAHAALQDVKALGVRLAIDDFGTGYSSLVYLKRYHPDTLKLDRSFVRGLPGAADDLAITRAIVQMAQTLGLRTVAEGVETAEQLAVVRALGCDDFQGFLAARPTPADHLVFGRTDTVSRLQ